ncbi:MAG: glycine zipper 2TM domain-containing protein [Rhodobacteraceae bacterium]|nr:MAG: glycine zipper 2TM domain-containing protein [Paracoccaceae bacterium]
MKTPSPALRRAVVIAGAALALAACETAPIDQRTQGQIIGGATGAILGAQIGGGSGQLIATGAGAVLGTMVGGNIGQRLDEAN